MNKLEPKVRKEHVGLKLEMRGTDYTDAKVLDLDGNEIGKIVEVVIKPRDLVTVVKVGDEYYKPCGEELDNIRDFMIKTMEGHDAIIVTNPTIDIKQIERTKEFKLLSSDGDGNYINEDERIVKDIIE